MPSLSDLNPSQREAATTLSGPLLVLAGAGTGKTRVITYRMAELIRSGISPDRILSVTFTNKAAREMQERTALLLGRRLKIKPLISTFHSFCVRVLRQEISALGFPLNFSIYDRGDQESAARTALRDIRMGEASMRPGDLLARISRWKMSGIGPKQATQHIENDLDVLAAVAYRKYQMNLRACAAVDFDDLLLLTLQLFQEHPDALDRQQSRFDHVQIDEYQDTNGAQFNLIEKLVRGHRNLCVVGDDDQSIYGWRGAEVQHILGFATHFPGARVVRLQDNYRCTDAILDLANRLVRHNRGRHEKELIPHKRSASAVRFLEFPDELKEAEEIVREIHDLVTNRNVPPDDIAILFRTNEQPRVFETELRRRRLRYVLVGGQSFFERREIRDLLAYLKVLAQPADEVSLLRIINVPARGIGATTVEKLIKRAVREKRRLWDVIPDAAAAGEVPPKAVAALQSFHDLLERYRREVDRSPGQLDATLAALISEINYESEIERQYKEPEQRMMRSSMLDQLVSAAREYIGQTETPSLSNFLEESSLMGRDEDFGRDERTQEQGIRLMTLHSAKGLEFPHVYLVGMEEGLLPHHRSLGDNQTAIEEERRLTYVGITRAMDVLTLSRAASRAKWGKKRPAIPSRFLHEMQDGDA